jgi:formiminoglutamase
MGPPPVDLAAALRIADAGDVAEPDGPRARRVRARTAELTARTDLAIALGGDNSITYATAQGADAAGLITLDAHFDLRDGVSNGSPVRRLVDDGLDPTRIVQIGIADFANSAAYARRAADLGIRVITLDELRRRGAHDVIAEAREVAGRGVAASISTSTSTSAIAPWRPAARRRCPVACRRGSCAPRAGVAADAGVRSADIVEVDATADAADGRTVRLAALCVLDLLAGLHDERSTHDDARPRPTRQERLGQPALDDHDRPLNARPARRARARGRLATRGLQLDAVLSSTALRARTTASFFAGARARARSGPRALRRAGGHPAGRRRGAGVPAVMVVAHDPGMTVLAQRLSGGASGICRPAPWRRSCGRATTGTSRRPSTPTNGASTAPDAVRHGAFRRGGAESKRLRDQLPPR